MIPTAQAARLTMHREGIRRLAAEQLGLPTSPYVFADNFDDSHARCKAGFGSPCVVKPVMSSSGKGQSVPARSRCGACVEYAQAGACGAGRVIVEGFIAFDYEITLLTVRHRHHARDGDVSPSFCAPSVTCRSKATTANRGSPSRCRAWPSRRVNTSHRRSPVRWGARASLASSCSSRATMCGFRGLPRPHDTGLVTLIHQDLFAVRPACAGDSGAAGRRAAARAGRFGGHLRRHRRSRHSLRGHRARARGPGIGPSTVRQARGLQEATDGRRARHRLRMSPRRASARRSARSA